VASPSPIPLSEAEQIVELQKELAWAKLKIQVLEERLRLERIKKYGPGSEKLNDAQLQLLDLEPGVSNAEVQAESQREPLPAKPEKPQKRRQHPGRQELPVGLARVERVIACTPEQCTCKTCGQSKAVIGYDVSEQLDVKPAQYFVVVTKREKRACKHCEEGGVVAAPVPERIIEKSLVSDRVVIDTVVAKYSDHLPLYRQSAILEREAGVEIGRATLDGWVMRVGELLIPLVGVMRRELLAGSYIQADETPVDVQLHDGRGRNHQAYLWQYSQPGGGVVFDFCLGRGREGPKEFLGQFEGILQTDGYVAYDRVGGPKLVHAGCWAHARRKFFDAVQLNPNDAVATRIVKLIDELFGIDAVAREEKLDHAARHVLRQEKGKTPGGDDPRGSRGSPQYLLAFECVGEGGELHALAVEKAHALPGACGVGVEQQPRGELDASGGFGPEELDPRRQPEGGPEGGGDSVHRGELPPDEDSDP
jgi:transposase